MRTVSKNAAFGNQIFGQGILRVGAIEELTADFHELVRQTPRTMGLLS